MSAGRFEVTPLPRCEAKDAAALLASGFAEDPLSCWLFPDPRRRRLLLRRLLFHGSVGDSLRAGAVDTIRMGGRLVAVSTSLPPGAFPPTRARSARLLPSLALAVACYPAALSRARRVLAADAAAHMEDRHWYAQAIAVENGQQGRGLGTALLETVLDRADQDKVTTFLVTSNPINLDWYRRYGFVALDEIRVLPEAPPFWPMARPAGS